MSGWPHFSNPSLLRIPVLLREIYEGKLRVPRFQRPFLWEPRQRLELFESIYNGEPIGSILVWRTGKHRLPCYMWHGPRAAFADNEEAAPEYVLDGQQRLTTLYSGLAAGMIAAIEGTPRIYEQWKREPEGGPVHFDLESESFVLPARRCKLPATWLPLGIVFDAYELDVYRTKLPESADKRTWYARTQKLASRLTDYTIPVIPLVTDDLQRTVRSFQRIQGAGTPTANVHFAFLDTAENESHIFEATDIPHDLAALADWLAARPPRWRDLHAAIPGILMQFWQPRDGRVTTALRRLDTGSPYMLRGAALAWLLSRAASMPHYEAAPGIAGDLRSDLPVRLAAALGDDFPADSAFAPKLELALLRHAAHIADRRRQNPPGCALVAWSLSRWLYRCVPRSPFHEKFLATYLSALLPRDEEPADESTLDPLHPRRLGPDGIDIADLAVVAGTVAHYHGPGPYLEPVPQPLVDALRRIAWRPARPGEQAAEDALATAPAPAAGGPALAAPGNALGWPAPHVAPPWVARRFLTDRRIAWLARASREAQEECTGTITRDPRRYSWLAFAVHNESQGLAKDFLHQAAGAWRVMRSHGETLAYPLAAMGAALLRELDTAERAASLEMAASSEEPFLLDSHAQAAGRAGIGDHWQAAVHALLDLAGTPNVAPHKRLNGALMAMRRTVEQARADRGSTGNLVAKLKKLMAEPFFLDQRALQREARRLGLDEL